MPDVIVVVQRDVAAARRGDARTPRLAMASIAIVADHANPRERRFPLERRHRLGVRRIIDHDEFDVFDRLRPNRRHALAQIRRPIVGRRDEADGWRGHHGRCPA